MSSLGPTACIVDYDINNSRYQVKLPSGSILSLKPTNLTQVSVCVCVPSDHCVSVCTVGPCTIDGAEGPTGTQQTTGNDYGLVGRQGAIRSTDRPRQVQDSEPAAGEHPVGRWSGLHVCTFPHTQTYSFLSFFFFRIQGLCGAKGSEFILSVNEFWWQHNGTYGQIVEVDNSMERYSVKLKNNKQLKIKWENVHV